MTREQKAARAAELYRAKRTIYAIARELRVHETTARQLIVDGGGTIRSRGPATPAKDPALDLPLGTLPPSHRLYALDQQMARARSKKRHAYEGGLGASSLADIAA
jgi:hypothetical protein